MRTRGDVACVTKRHHVLGHTWQDFWYGVVQSVVSFAITGAIAFIAVRRLKLSERAMQVRPKDAVTVGVVLVAILVSVAVPVFGALVVALLVARLFLEHYWWPRHPPTDQP